MLVDSFDIRANPTSAGKALLDLPTECTKACPHIKASVFFICAHKYMTVHYIHNFLTYIHRLHRPCRIKAVRRSFSGRGISTSSLYFEWTCFLFLQILYIFKSVFFFCRTLVSGIELNQQQHTRIMLYVNKVNSLVAASLKTPKFCAHKGKKK